MRYFSTQFCCMLGALLAFCLPIKGEVSAENPKNHNNEVVSVQKPTLSRNSLYQILVAELAGRRHLLPMAVLYYRMAAEETSDPAVAERATYVAFYSRDFKEALTAVKRWLSYNPDNLEANRILAALLIKDKQTEDARLPIQKLILATEDQPREDWLQIIHSLVSESGSASDVLTLLESEITHHPKRADLLLSLALLYANRDPEKAAHFSHKTLLLAPTWTQAILVKTKLLLDQKKLPEALLHLENSLKKSNPPIEIYQAYAQLLLEAKALSKAEKAFMVVLKKNPNDENALLSLGIIKANLQDFKGAEKYLSRVDNLVPDSSNIAFYRGYIHEQQKLYDEAIHFYGNVTEGNNYFIAQVQVSHLLEKRGKWDEAISHLKTIRVESPEEEIQIMITEAGFWSAHHFPEKSLTVLNAANLKHPEQTDILYTRAMVAQKMNNLSLVEQDLKKIISKEPRNVQALNALGYTLADQTNRYDEAYALIGEALAIDPKNPAVLDSMGWICYRMGDSKKAIFYLEAAYGINRDSEIAAHLAEVLWSSGKTNKAKILLQEASQIEPGHPLLKKVFQKINSSKTADKNL